MAHNLARDAGGAVRMAYRGESPWHSLGAIGPDHGTVDEWIRAAHLDYSVSLEPLYLRGAGMGLVECAMRRAVVRDGNPWAVLGTVGPGYMPIQNVEAFGIVEDLMAGGSMEIETAGSLGKGETAWMLLKNGQEWEVWPGDAVKPRLLVVTSHDGTRSLQAIPTAVRVVCQNTLNAVRDRVHIAVKHTAGAQGGIDIARRTLAEYGRAMKETAEVYRALASREMRPREIARYLEIVFPTPKGRPERMEQLGGVGQDVVAELLGESPAGKGMLPLAGVPAGSDGRDGRNGDTLEARRAAVEWLVDNGRGNGRTLLGAYNAVAEYVDHVYVSRADGSPRLGGAESALFGSGSGMKARAWDAARKMLVEVAV